jgi:hypothetical protein
MSITINKNAALRNSSESADAKATDRKTARTYMHSECRAERTDLRPAMERPSKPNDCAQAVIIFIKIISGLVINSFLFRFGSQPPIIYTETLNQNQLMLVITSLSESLAGYFYCSASYANSELLAEKVKVETYGKIS